MPGEPEDRTGVLPVKGSARRRTPVAVMVMGLAGVNGSTM